MTLKSEIEEILHQDCVLEQIDREYDNLGQPAVKIVCSVTGSWNVQLIIPYGNEIEDKALAEIFMKEVRRAKKVHE